MKFVGNNNANSIYEYNIQGYSKPTKGTDRYTFTFRIFIIITACRREHREKYIKAKYVTKEFIPSTSLHQPELTQVIFHFLLFCLLLL